VQVVIVPIVKKPEERESVGAAAAGIFSSLKAAGVRVKLDDNDRQVRRRCGPGDPWPRSKTNRVGRIWE
jgi:threonyl-tRNA synthetase